MSRFLLVSCCLLGVLAFATGCSNETDPTSTEALRKAEPLAYGCAFVEINIGSYGTASSKTKTPKCTQGIRCDELQTPDSSYDYIGGASFYSSTTYDDRHTFVGTCDDQEPLTNEANGFEPCYAAPALCMRDPNCLAMRDCVSGCGTDDSCTQRCLQNGYGASNLVASAKCAVRGWKSPELHAVFPEVPAE